MSEPTVFDQGAIQPIGFLIALSSDWMVSHVSANITEYVGKPSDEILGHHVNSLLCPDSVHSLRNRLSLLRDEDAIERLIRCSLLWDDRLFDASLHMSQRSVVIEAEPSSEQPYGDVTGTVRGMIGRLDHAPDMQAFLHESARQVRALTGYDRVAISRFDADGIGQVIAESARSGMASLLGKHFPPNGGPELPRHLRQRNPLRLVADVEAAASPIVPALDENGETLDLSLSVLRTAPPQTAEHLRKMGLRASMSISIVVDGGPWGLIVCHHLSPRCPSVERRSLTELFALMFSMRLEVRELDPSPRNIP